MQKKLTNIKKENLLKDIKVKKDSIYIDKRLCSKMEERIWRKLAKVNELRKFKQDLRTTKKFVQKFKKVVKESKYKD